MNIYDKQMLLLISYKSYETWMPLRLIHFSTLLLIYWGDPEQAPQWVVVEVNHNMSITCTDCEQ